MYISIIDNDDETATLIKIFVPVIGILIVVLLTVASVIVFRRIRRWRARRRKRTCC